MLREFQRQTLSLPAVRELDMDSVLSDPGILYSEPATRSASAVLLGGFGANRAGLSALRFDSGFHLVLADYVGDSDLVCRINSPNWLKFYFRVLGRNTIVFDGVGQYSIDSPRCVAMLQPADLHKADFLGRPGRNRWATIFLSPRFVTESLAIDPDALPRAVARFLAGQQPELYCHSMPLTALMNRAVADLIECDDDDPIRHVYAEAKALELVSFVLRDLAAASRATRPTQLDARSLERLHTARSILCQSIAAPPGLGELASRVGLNRSKLAAEFKACFGTTVYGFVLAQRMQRARDLLQHSSLTVERIAEELGYSHPRNFSQAFRRHFGVTPRATRRTGR